MEKPVRAELPDGSCLIETFGWSPFDGIRHKEHHLERISESAKAFGLQFPIVQAIGLMDAVSGDAPQRCRMTFSTAKGLELSTSEMPPPVKGKRRLALAASRLSSSDVFLRHKTSSRAVYDETRANLGDAADEALFLNEREELCEGTITNVFIDDGNGLFLTPPVVSGLLPGVLRKVLLEAGRAKEVVLTLDDLRESKRIFVGNSLRGLIPSEWIGDSIPLIP